MQAPFSKLGPGIVAVDETKMRSTQADFQAALEHLRSTGEVLEPCKHPGSVHNEVDNTLECLFCGHTLIQEVYTEAELIFGGQE